MALQRISRVLLSYSFDSVNSLLYSRQSDMKRCAMEIRVGQRCLQQYDVTGLCSFTKERHNHSRGFITLCSFFQKLGPRCSFQRALSVISALLSPSVCHVKNLTSVQNLCISTPSPEAAVRGVGLGQGTFSYLQWGKLPNFYPLKLLPLKCKLTSRNC